MTTFFKWLSCHFLPILACIALLSCNKKNCDTPIEITITTNSPVVSGWDLHMETLAVSGGRYVWSGPNGWTVDNQTISTDDNQETVPASVVQSGEYKVKVYNDEGCLSYEGKTTVQVIAPPNPPCSISPNNSTSSVIGIGDYSITSRVFSATSSYYTVEGAGSGQFMRFGFWGQTRPKPGVYEITDGFFGDEYGTTGLFIQAGMYQFLAQGGKAYVTQNSNGKLSVSICAIKFSNPINPSVPVTVSANITEP